LNIVFRVDSSFLIGSGHLMRCLALATELKNKGAKIIFICKDLPGNFNKLVSDKSIDLLTIDGPASKTISYDTTFN